MRDDGSISYSAAIESAAQTDTDAVASPFAARVEREATRRGFDRAARRAVLGDGARGWNLADERFPGRSRPWITPSSTLDYRAGRVAHARADRRGGTSSASNRTRMRDEASRAAGLCTSTGVVEAGCTTVISVRCMRAGMHWTVAGADAIIALRCCKQSGRFEDFWERRAQHRLAP